MSDAPALRGRKVDDPKDMTGAEKAAVILLALGDEQRQLWEMMDDEEIRVVSQAMVNLGNVTSGAVEKLIMEFVGSMSSTGSITGSVDQAQRLLSSFLPEDKVDQIMEDRAKAEKAASLREEDYQLAYAIDILKGLSALGPKK